MLPLVIIQTDPSSIVSGALAAKHIAVVVAFQLQETSVHRLELEMIAEEYDMEKA